MPGQFDEPVYPPAPEPPREPPRDPARDPLMPLRDPVKRRGSSTADRALPWLLGVLVVLLLAASGGLVTAWIVASLKAAPPPVAAGPTPTIRPVPTPPPTATPLSTADATQQPLHTPTAAPSITPEPEPFVHVVQRGEYLQYIADLYGVSVEDIVALNDITNPNRIRAGQELLIPGYGVKPTPKPTRR